MQQLKAGWVEVVGPLAGGVAIATCIWLALTNPYLEFEFRIAGRVFMFWELTCRARMCLVPKKCSHYNTPDLGRFQHVFNTLSAIAGKKALSAALGDRLAPAGVVIH